MTPAKKKNRAFTRATACMPQHSAKLSLRALHAARVLAICSVPVTLVTACLTPAAHAVTYTIPQGETWYYDGTALYDGDPSDLSAPGILQGSFIWGPPDSIRFSDPATTISDIATKLVLMTDYTYSGTTISDPIDLPLHVPSGQSGAILLGGNLTIQDSIRDSTPISSGVLDVASGAAFSISPLSGSHTLTFQGNVGVGLGGVIRNAGKISITSAQIAFYGNKVIDGAGSDNGGAVHNEGGEITFAGHTTFGTTDGSLGNTANSYGGALSNRGGTTIFRGSSAFYGNSVPFRGGALMYSNGEVIFDGPASFGDAYSPNSGNSANNYGGAIASELASGKLTFNRTAEFYRNTGRVAGGALFISARGGVTFKDTAYFGAAAVPDSGNLAYEGGAIRNYDLINFEAVNFFRNRAEAISPASYGFGGAISNLHSGRININGVAYFGNAIDGSGNFATHGGGAISNLHAPGYNLYNVTIRFNDSAYFYRNASVSEGFAFDPSSGGAIYNGGGAKIYFSGTANFGDASDPSSGNIAGKENVSRGSGGAIYNTGSDSTWGASRITFAEANFYNNRAAYGDGGAIVNTDGGEIVFTGHVNFGALTLDSGNIAENGGRGGAIFNDQGTGSTNSTIRFNDSVNFYRNMSRDEGHAGAIFNQGGAKIYFSGTANFGDASDPSSGNIAGKTGPGHGGAIFNAGSDSTFGASTITFAEANFYNNKVGFMGSGGAIFNGIGGEIIFTANANFGALTPDSGNSVEGWEGGAVYNSGNMEFHGETFFRNNKATLNGGAIWNDSQVDFHGPVTFGGKGYDEFGKEHIATNTVTASRNGGGLYNGATGTVLFEEDAFFFSNEVVGAGRGGAIYNEGNIHFRKNATFGDYYRTDNSAHAFDGGAIHIESGILQIGDSPDDKANFYNNRADEQGGAIQVFNQGTLILPTSEFKRNSGAIGGALHVGSGASVLFRGSSYFQENTALSQGGAIRHSGLVSGENFVLSNALFVGNTAGYSGGAISLYGATNSQISLINSIFIGNKVGDPSGSNYWGAAIYTSAPRLAIQSIQLGGTGGGYTLFSGNVSETVLGTRNDSIFLDEVWGGAARRVYLDARNTNDIVDMRDPMRSSEVSNVYLEKSGAGIWKLGGENVLNAAGYFRVFEGTLHLYRDGEVSNPGTMTGRVEAGSIDLGGPGTFELLKGTTLSVGGGNAIKANDIVFNIDPFSLGQENASLSFDLARATPGLFSSAMLVLNDYNGARGLDYLGNPNYSGDHLNLDLSSLPRTAGSYKLIEGSYVVQNPDVTTTNAGTLELFLRGEPMSNTRHSGAFTLTSQTTFVVLETSLEANRILEVSSPIANWNATTGVWDELVIGGGTSNGMKFLHGDVAVFKIPNAGETNIAVLPAGVLVSGLHFSGGAGTTVYKFTGGSITADAESGTFAPDSSAINGSLTLGQYVQGQADAMAAPPGYIPHSTETAFHGTVDLTSTTQNNFVGGVNLYSGRLKVATLAQLGTELSNVHFRENAGAKLFFGDVKNALMTFVSTGADKPAESALGTLISSGYASMPTLHFTDPQHGLANLLVYGHNADTQRLTIPMNATAHITSEIPVNFLAFETSANGGAIHLAAGAGLVLSGSGFLFEDTYSADTGGAIYIGASDNLFVSYAPLSFFSTEAREGGGIHNIGYAFLEDVDSKYSKGVGDGGFIQNDGYLGIGTLSSEHDETTLKGGTLYNGSNGQVWINDFRGLFGHGEEGGFIANRGQINIGKMETVGGSVQGQGGVIYNLANTIIIHESFSAKGAEAGQDGGVISNGGNMEITGDFRAEYSSAWEDGGAVANYGTFTIAPKDPDYIKLTPLFKGNKANGGGAIFNFRGTVSISGAYDCPLFESNSAEERPALYTRGGGAIYNQGGVVNIDVKVSDGNSIFYKNTVSKGWGGAIHNIGDSSHPAIMNITLQEGSGETVYLFRENYLYGQSDLTGGAVYNSYYSSLIINNNSTTTSLIKIEGNHTIGDGEICHDGGAIQNSGSSAMLYIDAGVAALEFKENFLAGESTMGGALSNRYSAEATLRSDRSISFVGNKASQGGAIYSGGQVALVAPLLRFSNNGARTSASGTETLGQGGAIYNALDYFNAPELSLVGSVEMINDPAITQAQEGGLIYNRQGNIFLGVQNPPADSDPYIYLYGGKVDTNGIGGLVYNGNGTMYFYNRASLIGFGGDAAKNGGGIYNDTTGKLYFKGTTNLFADNGASVSGGAIYSSASGLFVFDNETRFIHNRAGQAGGAIFSFFSQYDGFFFEGSAAFVGNTVTGAGLLPDTEQGGGAIYNSHGITVFGNGPEDTFTFIDNVLLKPTETASRGGAIYNTYTSTIVFNGVAHFSKAIDQWAGLVDKSNENTPMAYDGGAIYNEKVSSLSIAGENLMSGLKNRFMYNVAHHSGGAIYNYDIDQAAIVTLKNPEFKFNQAITGEGGAIYAYSNKIKSKIDIQGNSFFVQNKAAGSSGAIYFRDEGTTPKLLIGSGAMFTGNKAGADGGAIYHMDSEGLTLPNASFGGNKAEGNGGAIYASLGALSLENPVFTNNTASGLGGAIYVDTTLTITVTDGGLGQFSGNKDSTGANAIATHSTGTAATFNVGAGGALDIRDPIGFATATNPSSIVKNGSGILYLGGESTIRGNLVPAVSIYGGTLHLYREGEVANGANGVVGAGKLTITNGGTLSMSDGTTLSIGGGGDALPSGNEITAAGMIFGQDTRFAFDLAHHSNGVTRVHTDQMLTLSINGGGAVAFNGDHSVNLASLANSHVDYKLIQGPWLNSITGFGAGAVKIMGDPLNSTRAAGLYSLETRGTSDEELWLKVNDTTAGLLGKTLTWNGGSAEWNQTSTGLWTGGATQYLTGDHVNFNGGGSNTVTFTNNGVAPASVTVNNTGTYIFNNTTTGPGITGDTGFVKQGTGKVEFRGTHSYHGVTDIQGGDFILFADADLRRADGNIRVRSGALLGGQGHIGGEIRVDLGGFLAPGGFRPSQTGPATAASNATFKTSNNVILAAGATLVLNISGNNTSGYVHDTLAFTNAGANTLTLTKGAILYVNFDYTGSISDTPDFALSVITGAILDYDEVKELSIQANFFNGISSFILDINGVLRPTIGPKIPEPSTYGLLSGLVALGYIIWRRRKKKQPDKSQQLKPNA
ncbi:MAG: PEP-CTERM sorting domain-containing protein [Puniceicoccales bacterium]|jgi:predicted outer membrane repeat protein/autotransporter-associated beta strand protein|nr:PEP-CTERM sorting domain-containing protein [Puniceicoccales bacterium]